MKPVTLDDYEALSPPWDVRFSPDGGQIAYMRDATAFLIDTKSDHQPVELTKAQSGYINGVPAWSRDGKTLYLLWYSATLHAWEIWGASVDNLTRAERLTRTSASVSSLTISLDDRWWLFSASGTPVKKPVIEEKTGEEPIVVEAMVFKQDGIGFVGNDEANNVFAWDIKNRRPKQLSDGPANDTQPAWSPDGRTVAFVREDVTKAEYRKYVCVTGVDDLGEGSTRALITSLADRKAPQFSPDGSRIAYLWRDARLGPYGVWQLAMVSVEDGVERILTRRLNRTVVAFKFSHDGQYIYLLYENEGGRHLARIRLKSGRTERLIQGDVYVSSFDVNAQGDVAMIMNHMNDASDVYIFQDKKLRRLTNLHHSFFDKRKLGSKEQFSYTAKDNVEVQAFVTKPPDFDAAKKYPTVLRIHGGPVQQATYGYDFFAQCLAAKGYVVIEPNPAGSTGRGQGFINRVRKNWGFHPETDVLGTVDQAISQGYADPDRLAVIGYSYGGYLTNCLITMVPDKFKAASSGAGHSFVAANYGHDIYLRWYNWELGSPWDRKSRRKYEKLSPINDAHKVKTPTLFMCGAVDWNVPLLNSELFYQALKVLGVPTRLVVYPKAAHASGWDSANCKNGLHY